MKTANGWMAGKVGVAEMEKMIFVLSGLAQPLLLITLILTQLTLLETLRPEFQS